MRMTVPVTIGGNIRWRTLGDTKDMKISRKAQIREVPAGLSKTEGRENKKLGTEDISVSIGTGESCDSPILSQRGGAGAVRVHDVEDLLKR